MENLTETQVTTDKIYSGCILDFYRDTVRLPNGGTAPRELTRHVGASTASGHSMMGRPMLMLLR